MKNRRSRGLRRLVAAGASVTVLVVLAALTIAAAAGSARNAAGPTAATGTQTVAHVDHFKCYRVEQAGKAVKRAVGLQDQFGTSEGTTAKAELLCNPVEKQRVGNAGHITPIQHPESHLKCYKLHEKASKQQPVVIVNNQFGEDVLVVDRADKLCLPTAKTTDIEPGPVPQDLDHYKCYRAKSPRNRPAEQVVLRDQFHTEEAFVLKPILLCNPVEKRHAGQITPIQHPVVHLVCYQIESPTPFDPRAVRTRNQFGLEALKVIRPETLCVPSYKRRVDGGQGATPAGLDHFQCYDARSPEPFQPRPVVLTDQFGAGDAVVHDPFLLCNPVQKNDEPIQERELHLVCYRIDDKAEQRLRHVEISNQFGGNVLETERSFALCVPALKSDDPTHPPEPDLVGSPLDHFKCYKAKGFADGKRAVTLVDQFGGANVKVGKVIALCNPVEKAFAGQITPVRNPQAHLVCYRIGAKFDPRDVATTDQFGQLVLRVHQRRMLCLPSFKRQLGGP